MNLIFTTNFNLLSFDERAYFLMLRELADKNGRIDGKVALDMIIDSENPSLTERHHFMTTELLENGFLIENDNPYDVAYSIAKEYRK